MRTIALLTILLCGCASDVPPPKPIDCSKAEQDERKQLMASLIDAKLVKKYGGDSDTRAEIWATRALLARDFDAKANICKLSLDYYSCQSKSFRKIVLIDSITGKEVGQYTRESGLRMN